MKLLKTVNSKSSDDLLLNDEIYNQVKNYIDSIRVCLEGEGWFSRKPLPIHVKHLESMLYKFFLGKINRHDVRKICFPDNLKEFGLGVTYGGYIYSKNKNRHERALCIRCGHMKQSAFQKCTECDFAPSNELEGARSICFSSMYFSDGDLSDLSLRMKEGKEALTYSEQLVKISVEAIRERPALQLLLKQNRSH